VRTPSRYDQDLLVPSGLINAPPPLQFPTFLLKGSPDFVSETLLAYAVGYRAAIGSKLAASVCAFYNDYHHLRSTTATPTTAVSVFPYPIFFQNNLEGQTHGLEISASYQIGVRPGEVDATGATNETADPQLRARLGNCPARHQEPRAVPHGPESAPRLSHRVRLPIPDARADRA
jgi:iron complex outermembrane receptor protein